MIQNVVSAIRTNDEQPEDDMIKLPNPHIAVFLARDIWALGAGHWQKCVLADALRARFKFNLKDVKLSEFDADQDIP